MKTITGAWIVTMTVSLWLFFTPYVHAINTQVLNPQDFHHLSSDSLNSKQIISSLQKYNFSQLSLAFVENKVGLLDIPKSNCLESFNLTELEANYCAVIAHSFDFVAWNNLGSKLFSLGHNRAALAAYDHSLLIRAC